MNSSTAVSSRTSLHMDRCDSAALLLSLLVNLGKLLWVPLNLITSRTVESAKRSFLISHQTESMREQLPSPSSPLRSSKRPPLYVENRHGYCRRTVSLLELLAFLSTPSTVAKPLALPSIRLGEKHTVSFIGSYRNFHQAGN